MGIKMYTMGVLLKNAEKVKTSSINLHNAANLEVLVPKIFRASLATRAGQAVGDNVFVLQRKQAQRVWEKRRRQRQFTSQYLTLHHSLLYPASYLSTGLRAQRRDREREIERVRTWLVQTFCLVCREKGNTRDAYCDSESL